MKNQDPFLYYAHARVCRFIFYTCLVFVLSYMAISEIEYVPGEQDLLMVASERKGPNFNNYLFVFHVSYAWALYLISTIAGISSVYLIIFPNSIYKLRLFSLIESLTYAITCLLLCVVVTGSCWSKYAWGAYFTMDSKFLLFLFASVVFSIVSYKHYRKELDKNILPTIIVIFFCLLPLMYYVSVWIAGLHQGSTITTTSISIGIDYLVLAFVNALGMVAFIFNYCFLIVPFSSHPQAVRDYLKANNLKVPSEIQDME